LFGDPQAGLQQQAAATPTSCNIAQEISLATASVGAWGRFLNWRTLDSARQFAAAARIGYNATETLSALESVSA
jgi:hypothetical protein